MALVQAGFMAAVVMYPLYAGVKCTVNELEDYIFFWRRIGYLLGISDEYNVCCGNYAETYAICKEIEVEVMLRGLRQPPEQFALMADAYTEGIKAISVPMLSKESIISFSVQGMGHSMPGWVELTWLDWFSVQVLELQIAMIRWFPGYETLFNHLTMKGFWSNLNLVEKQLSAESKRVCE